MGNLGKGVRENRIDEDDGWFRVAYVASIGDAVYVLHCFQKKTNKVSKKDADLIASRFKAS